jgi:hypothetical protein
LTDSSTNIKRNRWPTNLLNSDLMFQLLAQLEYVDYQRAVWEIVNKITREQVQEGPIWRQIRFLSVIGPAALPPELLDRVSSAPVTLHRCYLMLISMVRCQIIFVSFCPSFLPRHKVSFVNFVISLSSRAEIRGS